MKDEKSTVEPAQQALANPPNPDVASVTGAPVLNKEKAEDDELAIYEDVDDDIGLDDQLEAAMALKPNSKGTNSASSIIAVAQKTESSEEITSQTNWEDLLNDDFLEDPSVGEEDPSIGGGVSVNGGEISEVDTVKSET